MNQPNPHNNNNNNDKKKKGGKKGKKRKAVTPPLPLPVKKEEELLKTTTRTRTRTRTDEGEEEGGRRRREKVLGERSKRLKQLAKVYRDYYWCLIEDLKTKHLQYLWNLGTTPFPSNSSDETTTTSSVNPYRRTNNGGCDVHSCKNKAMALTRFCHSHIIFDPNQLLYKPCSYPTKCSPSGPTLCMKPILKSAVPSLCSSHLEKAEKHLSRCLRNEGFNALGTNRHPPKLNVVVAEFVRQIQSNRRENL